MKTKRLIPTILLMILLAAACAPKETPMPTPDIGAIQTAAAQTVMADILATQSAEAALTPLATPTAEATEPPTETPTVTLTVSVVLTPGAIGTALGLCDDSNFNPTTVDVTVPDGEVMTAGQEFLKTWKIRNTGSCTWGAGYHIVYAYGEKMNGTAAAVPVPVTPNQEVDISVQFKAPAKAGQYSSTWRMANAQGSAFGQFFYVNIVVR